MRGYAACLASRGVPINAEGVATGKFYIDPNAMPRYRAQFAACESKKPESVSDRFKREHPQEFQDRLQKFIACMRANGQKVIYIAPDGWGVSDADAPTTQLSTTATEKCETKAYRQ